MSEDPINKIHELVYKFNEEVAAMKKVLGETSQKLFIEGCQEIFDKHPTLTSFSWTQFTPYFNDGEPCEFSAHTDSLMINGEQPEWADCEEYYEQEEIIRLALDFLEGKELDKPPKPKKSNDSWNNGQWEWDSYQDKLAHYKEFEKLPKEALESMAKLSKASIDIQQLFEDMQDSALEAMFGDHCRVTIYRDSVSVSDHKHE